jgi:thiamine biosynthesis protein ThiS
MTIVLNGEERECGEDWTIADLLADLGLSGRRVAVEVNRDIIARDEYAGCRFSAGAIIEIVHFVGGG